MKLKTFGLITATLITSALMSGVQAQDGRPVLDRPGFGHPPGPRGDRGPGPRGDVRPGPRRGRPGGDPQRMIDRLDTDGDGMISEDEFLAPKLDEVDRTFEHLDRNNDGLISSDEAEPRRPLPKRPVPPVIDREAVLQCVRETIANFNPPTVDEDRFAAIDLNGDGSIDLTELSTALNERAMVQFERLDADGNGYITLEELQAAQEEQINIRRVVRACIDQVSGA